MNARIITADLLTATAVISQLAAAPLQQKCRAVEEIAATGLQVDQLSVRQLMDIAMKVAPARHGTATMVATSTDPQRREILRLLADAGIDTATVHAGLASFLVEARVLMPQGISLVQALRGISYAGAARLMRVIRKSTTAEEAAP